MRFFLLLMSSSEAAKRGTWCIFGPDFQCVANESDAHCQVSQKPRARAKKVPLQLTQENSERRTLAH